MKLFQVFITALKLGCTSFGGPIAHLSYFHDEYVTRKKWISAHAYADLVALCQFLPGPASSQVGMAIGLSRAGILGAIVSWIGFTLPSALILILFGLGLSAIDVTSHKNWLHGLKVVSVAVVAQAILGMGKKLCPDKERITIAIITSVILLFFSSTLLQISVLVVSGIFGVYFLKSTEELPHDPIHKGKKSVGFLFLILFFVFLIVLPLLRTISNLMEIQYFDSFYRAGALVFGGGHVVLPLLQAEVVPTGWVSNDLFMAGYGISNAIPGPLFAFSSFLGAVSSASPNGWVGAILCLVAAFLPSFFLVVGALPFWEQMRTNKLIRKAMLGINASVVGILLAALYNPVWTSAVFSAKDFALVILGFLLLEFWKLPSWLVVIATVLVSFLIYT
ncbi:Chromate transporter [Leptospira biflexa serovar Patoc strain 'Patoc 1 (Ames)']|uniref:Putative chromate transporter putative membrane protein n=1 Tax=Leptospira biflexa serovar Patoc (strain Patoc 1 / ATCC 23582 / Paris) TaxID=456481 RepID=B0SIY4_LEPBP|nr:chromate efflux transporter [Leptospira biflexa]ABZ92904.1 Chromate transporter [Leptospira biflexa serovar Patoc strain 'Patoc 1 (Ames)']ABZ96512.1 Putative chromate transporter; putative membrane protein [Leptospira biflexa serovar Patoc strain 'Patoc 1 (Paris)']